MRNPVAGLETVAIAPFFNLSQERTVDGREFALAYYSELQKVPGFEVLPVGVTERAMVENGISLTSPEDAVRLAKILDVDAVVIGAVTDYDPYNPRIGLKIAWYSPRQWLFLPNEDPTVPFFNRSAAAPVKHAGRPMFGMARAQSPDDADEWVPVDFSSAVNVSEGNWETVGTTKTTSAVLLAQAGLPQLQPFLPDGTSLLVPAGDTFFPTLPAPEPASDDEWPGETITINYQDVAQPELPVQTAAPFSAESSRLNDLPASDTDFVVPLQGTSGGPPVEFVPAPIVQPITPSSPPPAPPATIEESLTPPGRDVVQPQLPESPPFSEPAASPNTPLEKTPPFSTGQPGSAEPIGRPVRQPAGDQSEINNPFNRHIPVSSEPVNIHSGRQRAVPEIEDRQRYLRPPRIAAAEPEFPTSSQQGSTPPAPAPLPADEATAGPLLPNGLRPSTEPMPSTGPLTPYPAPVMTTPLFPVPRPEMNPLPTELPRSTVPALIYDEQIVVAPADFEPTEPLMAYVRLFDATDRRLIARLSDYLELTGQLRSGDLEAYMKRSEFFRKFTAHVMISEMLQLHGGEVRRQLILKPRKYR